MKKGIKRQWVAALRSGKYKQALGVLQARDFNTYKLTNKMCCLGVLRQVMNPHDKSDRDGNEYLNDQQLAKAGLLYSEQLELSKLNDERVPFEVIAGVINETL